MVHQWLALLNSQSSKGLNVWMLNVLPVCAGFSPDTLLKLDPCTTVLSVWVIYLSDVSTPDISQIKTDELCATQEASHSYSLLRLGRENAYFDKSAWNLFKSEAFQTTATEFHETSTNVSSLYSFIFTTWHTAWILAPQPQPKVWLLLILRVNVHDIPVQHWESMSVPDPYFPIFFFFFSFFPLPLEASETVRECCRRVSAPQGKDYFIMRPTHMLVLLLVRLPNGQTPKGARSPEVNQVWETEETRGSVSHQLQIYCITEKANLECWGRGVGSIKKREIRTGM